MSRTKKIIGILVPEILILVILGVLIIIRWRSPQNVDVPISDWKSDYVEFDNVNGWYVNEEIVKDDEDIVFLYGPFIDLEKGTYCIKINYHCDYNQYCRVSEQSDGVVGQYHNLKTGEAILSKNYDRVSYDFEAEEDIEGFEVIVRYNSKGHLQVNSITIEKTAKGLIRKTCIVFAIFVCLNLCILFWDKIKRKKQVLSALAGITILTSLPLFINGIGRGHDIVFHLMRIEGISREIRLGAGNIPVRMSSEWLDGFGYPVSIFYGDLLLYIPAVMRLFGFSVTEAYKFFVILINLGTTLITYFCMKTIFKRERFALLTCLAYCTASYRLATIYFRSAVGEYSAMMFIPIVAMAVYKIYTDDASDYKRYKRNAVFLAIGMSGLIGTHMLSVEMAVFILIIVCLSLFKLTFRKNTIIVYVKAIAWTIAVSAYFIVPFLDYYINVSTIVKYNSNFKSLIQDSAASINDIFSFFVVKGVPLTPGLILMGVFIIAIALWISNQCDRIIKVLVLYVSFILVVASNIFPWDHLITNYRLGIILSQVQFPWRYLSIATIILTLLLGNILVQIPVNESRKNEISIIIILAGCFMTFFFISIYSGNANFIYFYDGQELDTYAVIGGEYLPEGTNTASLSTDIYSKNMQKASIVLRRGSSMKIRCIASDEDGLIEIPLFNYKGYQVTDDDGNVYQVENGANNQIIILVPAGFDGNLYVEYREPWYWRLAELISLMTVLGLCVSKGIAVRRKVSDKEIIAEL